MKKIFVKILISFSASLVYSVSVLATDSLAFEPQSIYTDVDENGRYLAIVRYVNLKSSASVDAKCLKGDLLITGGCLGPNWLTISKSAPSLDTSSQTWSCIFAPLQKVEIKGTSYMVINPVQGAKRVDAALSARALCQSTDK
tara:strand:- start:11149 stop:11574 length:426 start_codon:yes stop_codon:yes gene_type:complete